MSQQPKDLPNFINAHTHLFNADDTPTYLAKRWPFYYLINTRWAIYFLKQYRKRKSKKFTYKERNKVWQNYFTTKSPVYEAMRRIFLLFVNLIFFFYGMYIG